MTDTLDMAWPFGVAVTPNAVDAFITFLRRKLGPRGAAQIEPSAASATGWSNRERRPLADAALVRRVRWRLLAWSSGSTLAVLILLGTLIYIAVASSLESAAVEQLRQRAAILAPRIEMLARARLRWHSVNTFNQIVSSDPGRPGVSFVGGSSAGTLAFVIGPNDAAFPDVAQVFNAQLPNATGVDAARLSGESIELDSVDGTPVRILSHRVTVGV